MSAPCYYCDLERGIDCKLCIHKVDVAELIQQAHREGWEQCRREASHICKEGIPTSWGVTSSRELSNAIAVMEYNESTNG